MKIKGISFIEEHVEKAVLGGVGVLFLSVLAWQLFPTTVKVDGQDLPLSGVDKEIASKTSALNLKLDQPREPLAKQLEGKLQAQAAAFNAKLAAGVTANAELPRIEALLAGDLNLSGAVSSATEFHVPRFSALAMRPTLQVDDTIDETVFKANPKLGQYFAEAVAPFDLSWLVPSAQIDLKSMRAELKSSTPTQAQLPAHWYDDTLFLIDVNFNREEKLDDGSFGKAQIIDVVPGAFTLRSEIERAPDARLRDAVWTSLREKSTQRSILQPDFLPTKRSNFSASSMLADPTTVQEGEDPFRGLKKAVVKKSLEVKRLTDDLQELGGPLEDTSKEDKRKEDQRKKDEEEASNGGGGKGGSGGTNRPGGGLGGGGGGGGGLSGGMDGGKNTGGADPKDANAKEKRIRMTKLLKEQSKKLAALEKQLSDKNLAFDATKTSAAASNDLAVTEKAIVWAHDLGVVPGKTYRYQTIVKTYNPFFTNGGVLPDSQKQEADSFTRSTAVSAWSEPVTVAPRIAFFVTDAVPGEGRLGVGQATVEVFCYRDGERRFQKFTVQPGDAIGVGKNTVGVDFETGFYLVDVVPDPTAERNATDRRASGVVVVQSNTGKIYEIRVPKQETSNRMRTAFQDEIEIAKANDEAEKLSDSKDGDQAGGKKPTPPPNG